MAEESANIEINNPPKKINNSREEFLFENENLIIGKKGMTFQYYPTKNEKLKSFLNAKYNKNKNNNSFYKTFYNNKNSINNAYSLKKLFYAEKFNKNNSLDNKLEVMPKSMSQTNYYFQQSWHYRNKLMNNLKNKNTNSSTINNPHRQIKSKLMFDKFDKSDNSTNQDYLNNKNYFNKTLKNFSPISNSKIQLENKFYKNHKSLSKLQKMKDYNKRTEISNHKTHFKGIESIYIKPKEIYDLFKKEDAERMAKYGSFDINITNKKEKKRIEKKNEYKSDMKELIEEEKIIQNIVRTKEFSELLGNNKFFRDAEYNDLSKYSVEDTKNNYFYENEEEKNQKMNYLRKIAFEKKCIEIPSKHNPPKLSLVKKNTSNDKKDNENENESFFENNTKKKKKEKNNLLIEREDQLLVDGKLFHMKNQIDKICKELLNKYKIHNVLKK
jgi:hypothetical protein